MTATMWIAKDGFWRAYGRDPVSLDETVPPEEWPPTLGTYKPGATTTGPRPFLDDDVTPRVLTRHDGDYLISTAGKIVENLEIYGRIIVQSGGTNATVRNCIVRGPGNITAWPGGNAACIDGTSSSLRGLTVVDSRIDPTGRENPWIDGFRGSDVTLTRVEIKGTADGYSMVTPAGNITVEGCWIHDGYYTEWIQGAATYPTLGGAKTHPDCVQIQRGKNIAIRYNNIGGTRHPGAPHPSPYTTINPTTVAYKNSGDDYENSCFTIKQESSNSLANKIENVTIQGNWIAGGNSSINLSFSLENDLSSVSIIDNRFIRSTWDAEAIAVTGRSQIYIIRDTAITATVTGNVFDDDDTPVPITRGIVN